MLLVPQPPPSLITNKVCLSLPGKCNGDMKPAKRKHNRLIFRAIMLL